MHQADAAFPFSFSLRSSVASLLLVASRSSQTPSKRGRHALPAAWLALILATTGISSAITVVRAQVPAPVGVVRLATLADTLPLVSASPGISDDKMLGRMALGIVGWVGGAFMGAVLGAGTVMGCHGEMCQLNGAVPGAMLGSVLASVIASSEPNFSSPCTNDERLKSAVKGALEAAVLGGVLGAPFGAGGAVLGAFGGVPLGSGVGASICKPKTR